MQIKALVIGHAYAASVNRDKWYQASQLPGLEVKVVVPMKWRDEMFMVFAECAERDRGLIYPLPTWWDGQEVNYVYLRDLSKLMREFKPDILHVEQGDAAISYSQALWLKQRHAPAAKALFFTWVNLYKTPSWRYKLTRGLVEKYNLAHSDGAIAGNADARAILRRKGFAKPVRVLPQIGVDPDLFSYNPQPQLKTELGLSGLVIGYVGRLLEDKGICDLLLAFGRLAKDRRDGDLQLLLLGTGPWRSTIEQISAEMGIARQVKMCDAVPHLQVVPYLNCMDVLVLPSRTTPRTKEQFGHVLVEAMSALVPVIGSSSGEIPNVVGDAGLIYSEGDVQALAAQLNRLVESPELRCEYANKGRARVQSLYTHRVIAEQTYGFWRELVET